MTLSSEADYLTAVKKAQEAAYSYYQEDGLRMADKDYDALVRAILEADRKHPTWTIDHGLAKVAGGTSSKADVAHAKPMLSLDNVFSSDELRSWMNGRKAGEVTWCVEPKYDGLSLAVTYINGVLTRLVTRGTGTAGEDMTSRLDRIGNLPKKLKKPLNVEVRGEVLFTHVEYEKANTARVASGKKAYVNARNAASGAFRADSLDYPVSLTFIPHGLAESAAASYPEMMKALKAAGLPTLTQASLYKWDVTLEEAVRQVEYLEEARHTLPFEIDGAVVKISDKATCDKLGMTSRAPRWGIAVKFPPVEASVVVSDIELQVGRLGTITPVAKLGDGVFVGGTTITSVTLHNFDDLARKDIRVGDTVLVRRAGDVIPEIAGVLTEERTALVVPFTPPVVCPRCGSGLDKSQVRWRCVQGRKCGLVESLSYAASRDVFDIDGCGPKVIAALVNAELVEDLADLFTLTVNQVEVLDRMGEASATKLVNQIQEAKNAPLSKVITSLGMKMTGRRMGRRLAQHFKTMEAFQAATFQELQHIDGIGVERAAVILEELTDQNDLIEKLANVGVNMTEPEVERGDSLPWDGWTVVVSGSIEGHNRDEAQQLVEKLGAKATGSVTSKTSALVTGANPGGSKVMKAENLHIPIIPAEEMLALIAGLT